MRYLIKFIKKILPEKLINFLSKKTNFSENQILKKLKFNNYKNVFFIGSKYGGWSFLKNNYLKKKYIISAGLGEDASFDVELISKYKCKILAVDPTPNAIKHYNQIIDNKGRRKSIPYVEGGKQSIDSYELSNINERNYKLINKALYNIEGKELKFYKPLNNHHVSYSLNKYQYDYKERKNYINVKTITVKSIMKKFNIKNLEMIKLDTEGAATEIILKMLKDKIFPRQILVEFEELIKVEKKSLEKFFYCHYKILSYDYKLIKTLSAFPNFLYARV